MLTCGKRPGQVGFEEEILKLSTMSVCSWERKLVMQFLVTFDVGAKSISCTAYMSAGGSTCYSLVMIAVLRNELQMMSR